MKPPRSAAALPDGALIAGPWGRPGPWLALVPVLCLGLAFVWGASGAGVIPARGAGALLLAGCLLALVPTRLGWSWRSPLPWLVAAIAWQAVALAGWAAAREPGLLWWGERCAVLLTAIGVCGWSRGGDPLPLVRGLVTAGAGVLALGVVGQLPAVANWPCGPDIPFGNPNFNVGGALPLLGLALPFWRDRATVWAAGVGLLAALVLGSGLRWNGDGLHLMDATRAVWPGLGALVGMAVVLRLPRASHGWIIGLGEIAVLIGLALLIAGVVPLPAAGPSTGYRLAIWHCALEAFAQAPLLGSGPAAAVVVLQEQASSPAAWLWVPSYAEHAHNEYLNILVEVGVPGALLLLAALLTTLAPLWRRRDEPVAAALLIAWAGVLTQALVESHLSQPGPLLLLALLAGVSWAVGRPGMSAAVEPVPAPEPPKPAKHARKARPGAPEAEPAGLPLGDFRRLLPPLAAIPVAALIFAQLTREFRDGGSTPMIALRAERRMEELGDAWEERARVAAGVRARVGDLDLWLSKEAIARTRAQQFDEAEDLALQQLARLPPDIMAMDLLIRLRDRRRGRGDAIAAQRVQRFLEIALERSLALQKTVPDNGKNHVVYAALPKLAERIARRPADQAE